MELEMLEFNEAYMLKVNPIDIARIYISLK